MMSICLFSLMLAILADNASVQASSEVTLTHRGDDVGSVAKVRPTSNGFQAVTKDSLSVMTSNLSGYSMYISMIDEENALISGKGLTIASTSGTTDLPAALDVNSWGFGISQQDASITISGFDEAYDSLLVLTDGQARGKWAAVPGKSDMVLVQKTDQAGEYDLDVFYGFRIDDQVIEGSYSGTVLYTVLNNPLEFEVNELNMSPNSTDNLTGGDMVYITAQITPAVSLEDVGLVAVRIGEGDCINASGVLEDGRLEISCVAPTVPLGEYDVGITVAALNGFTQTIPKGYAVELQRISDDLSISPSRMDVGASEELTISTSITTPGLTREDVGITIGEYDCPVETVSYNESGYLVITCNTPQIADAGVFDLALTIEKYGHNAHADFLVGEYTLSEIAYLQQMTPSICSNTATPEVGDREIVPTTTLTDKRDGKQYTVSKLADGNCWMTQNLRLGESEELVLSSMESDVEDEFRLPAVQTSGQSGWNNSVAHLYYTGDEETGAVYNWLAATAGQGVDGAIAGTNNSICPKGWTLPKMEGELSYGELLAAYGWGNNSQVVDVLIGSPFNFAFSGGYYYGYGGTNNGEYWTATPHSNESNAYFLKIESLSRRVMFTAQKPRSGGAAVRCVARREG